jgi:hypothetical protein
VTRSDESSLGLARGAVREGLAALEAFSDLLGSRRVGPRALDRARSDMGEASTALCEALRSLDQALAAALGPGAEAMTAARALSEHAASRAAALAAVFAASESLADARRRLALEAAIRKHGAELRDAIALCDLLAAAAVPAPTELDLVDVLDQRFGGKPAEGASVLRLGVEAPRPATLVADRHVLGGLVEVAASIIAKSGTTNARLGVTRSPGGALSIRIVPAARTSATAKTTMFVPLRAPVPGALEVARVAARRVGLGIEVDPATNAVSITSETRPSSC